LEIEIVNLYSNIAMPKSNLIGDHGQSFLIRSEEQNILFDVGTSGKKLLHNMKELNVEPNDIDLLVLSHGHYDHTHGLPEFLNLRTVKGPLRVLAHPGILAPRRIKVLFFTKNIGFPKLTEEQREKISFDFDTKPRKITDYIRTSGEIIDRPYRQGIEPRVQRKVNHSFTTDMVPEDLTLYIETQEGQVIVTGCGHAGIENICQDAKKTSNEPIKAIIGGTHMVRYSKEEVLQTKERFVQEFDNPDLYLNHCTDKLPVKILRGTKTIEILQKEYKDKKVLNCFVGTKLSFPI
jgi:7,8-dihydropterin-6-yl-methyl-4-(beta-D-ribofuranosyl)aminobenzene 5'-phosphate synthase